LEPSLACSFGMLGCDLHCAYCQNWVTSQALRDPAAVVGPMRVTPAELVLDALRQGGRIIVSTYNEPLITSEWAVAVFKEARAAGLVTGFVSNGNGTLQVLEFLRPWVDLYKVDLKSFEHTLPELSGTSHRTLRLCDHGLLSNSSGLLPVLWRENSWEVEPRVSTTGYLPSICAALAPSIRFACAGLLRSHLISWLS